MGLIKLFAIPFIIITIYGQDIFSYIFGEDGGRQEQLQRYL